MPLSKSSGIQVVPVSNYTNLPATSDGTGKVYLTNDTGNLYVFQGNVKRELSGSEIKKYIVIPTSRHIAGGAGSLPTLTLTAQETVNSTIEIDISNSVVVNLPNIPPFELRDGVVVYPWDGVRCKIVLRDLSGVITLDTSTTKTIRIMSNVRNSGITPKNASSVYNAVPEGQRTILMEKDHVGYANDWEQEYVVIGGNWWPANNIDGIGGESYGRKVINRFGVRPVPSSSVASRTIFKPEEIYSSDGQQNAQNRIAQSGFCYFYPMQVPFVNGAFVEPSASLNIRKVAPEDITDFSFGLVGSCFARIPSYVSYFRIYDFTAVNYSGYPLFYTFGNSQSNNGVIRLGAVSFNTQARSFPATSSSPNPNTRIAMSFQLQRDMTFAFSVLTDGVSDAVYVAEKLIVGVYTPPYNSYDNANFGMPLIGEGIWDRSLIRNDESVGATGSPKVITFNITAKGGDSIALFVSNAGTNKDTGAISGVFWGR